MGNSRVTVDEMVDYFQTAGKPYPKEALSKGGAESIEVFCRMYYDEAVAEGVRPEVAFCADDERKRGFFAVWRRCFCRTV